MTQMSAGKVPGIPASGQFRIASVNPEYVPSAYMQCRFVPGAGRQARRFPTGLPGAADTAAVHADGPEIPERP